MLQMVGMDAIGQAIQVVIPCYNKQPHIRVPVLKCQGLIWICILLTPYLRAI